jgi:hypothetical protein
LEFIGNYRESRIKCHKLSLNSNAAITLPLFPKTFITQSITSSRANGSITAEIELLSAQPVVTTTANVIYTIPTNDPSRFSTANVSATTSVHQYGESLSLI